MFRPIDQSRDSVERGLGAIKLPRELDDKKFQLQQDVGRETNDMNVWGPFSKTLEALCTQATLLREGKIGTQKYDEGTVQRTDLAGLKTQIEYFKELTNQLGFSDAAAGKVNEFTLSLWNWAAGQSHTLYLTLFFFT